MKILQYGKRALALLLILFLLPSPARGGELSIEEPTGSDVMEVLKEGNEFMEILEDDFAIPTGTFMEVEGDTEEVVDITSDDARDFIVEKFPFWVMGRLNQYLVDSIGTDTAVLGDSGRFYIPDVGINVALYYANEMSSHFAQQIVDELDAGVYTPHVGGQPYLADHSTQGFSGIRYCVEGTLAYWKHVDRIDIFICTAHFNGSNDGLYIYDYEGKNCFFENEGGMFTYTCNEDWQHVAIAYWQPVATLWLQ